MHEGDEVDALADLFGSDGLAGQGLAEADLFPIDTEPAALSDRDGFIVEGIRELTDIGVGKR